MRISKKTKQAIETRFMEFWNGTTNVVEPKSEFPNTILLTKDGKVLFKLDPANCGLYCDNDIVWQPLKKEFKINDMQLQDILIEVIAKRLNSIDLLPCLLDL